MRVDAGDTKRHNANVSGALEDLELKAIGEKRRRTSGETGQCANDRSRQHCAISHGPEGRGHGRWLVWANTSAMRMRLHDSGAKFVLVGSRTIFPARSRNSLC